MLITNSIFLTILSIITITCSLYWMIYGYISIPKYEKLEFGYNFYVSRGIAVTNWFTGITTLKIGVILYVLLLLLIKYRDTKVFYNHYLPFILGLIF